MSMSIATNTDGDEFNESEYLRFFGTQDKSNQDSLRSKVESKEHQAQSTSEIKNMLVKNVISKVLKSHPKVKASGDFSSADQVYEMNSRFVSHGEPGEHRKKGNALRQLDIEKLQQANREKKEQIEKLLKKPETFAERKSANKLRPNGRISKLETEKEIITESRYSCCETESDVSEQVKGNYVTGKERTQNRSSISRLTLTQNEEKKNKLKPFTLDSSQKTTGRNSNSKRRQESTNERLAAWRSSKAPSKKADVVGATLSILVNGAVKNTGSSTYLSTETRKSRK